MSDRPRDPSAELGGIRVPVREEADVIVVRRRAREMALAEGFPEGRAGAVATAVSEVAWNIVVHARSGEISIAVVEDRGRRGLRVLARDRDRGIADVELAMQDGYSTARSLGLGLASAKRLMDEFHVDSAVGEGTTITMKKWAHERD
jgi:serine/threonine-protein kinase RsbT